VNHFYGNGKANHHLGTGLFIHKGIRSAVVRVEDISDVASRPALGPPTILSTEYGGLFPRGKAAGREAEHLTPFSAEVRNAWSCNSSPQYVFIACCLVKHRDSFTFTLLG
jgi:hypothetical protein